MQKKLLESILNGTHKHGGALPAERVLCGLIGMTRPTLRETLQRLSKDRWLTIQHGKSTQINDSLTHGGLGLLSSLTRYGRLLSMEMVDHLDNLTRAPLKNEDGRTIVKKMMALSQKL